MSSNSFNVISAGTKPAFGFTFTAPVVGDLIISPFPAGNEKIHCEYIPAFPESVVNKDYVIAKGELRLPIYADLVKVPVTCLPGFPLEASSLEFFFRPTEEGVPPTEIERVIEDVSPIVTKVTTFTSIAQKVDPEDSKSKAYSGGVHIEVTTGPQEVLNSSFNVELFGEAKIHASAGATCRTFIVTEETDSKGVIVPAYQDIPSTLAVDGKFKSMALSVEKITPNTHYLAKCDEVIMSPNSYGTGSDVTTASNVLVIASFDGLKRSSAKYVATAPTEETSAALTSSMGMFAAGVVAVASIASLLF